MNKPEIWADFNEPRPGGIVVGFGKYLENGNIEDLKVGDQVIVHEGGENNSECRSEGEIVRIEDRDRPLGAAIEIKVDYDSMYEC